MPNWCYNNLVFYKKEDTRFDEMIELFDKYYKENSTDYLEISEIMNDLNIDGPRRLKIADLDGFDFQYDLNEYKNKDSYELDCVTRWGFDYNDCCDLQSLLKYFNFKQITNDFKILETRTIGNCIITEDNIDYYCRTMTDEESQEEFSDYCISDDENN